MGARVVAVEQAEEEERLVAVDDQSLSKLHALKPVFRHVGGGWVGMWVAGWVGDWLVGLLVDACQPWRKQVLIVFRCRKAPFQSMPSRTWNSWWSPIAEEKDDDSFDDEDTSTIHYGGKTKAQRWSVSPLINSFDAFDRPLAVYSELAIGRVTGNRTDRASYTSSSSSPDHGHVSDTCAWTNVNREEMEMQRRSLIVEMVCVCVDISTRRHVEEKWKFYIRKYWKTLFENMKNALRKTGRLGQVSGRRPVSRVSINTKTIKQFIS